MWHPALGSVSGCSSPPSWPSCGALGLALALPAAALLSAPPGSPPCTPSTPAPPYRGSVTLLLPAQPSADLTLCLCWDSHSDSTVGRGCDKGIGDMAPRLVRWGPRDSLVRDRVLASPAGITEELLQLHSGAVAAG